MIYFRSAYLVDVSGWRCCWNVFCTCKDEKAADEKKSYSRNYRIELTRMPQLEVVFGPFFVVASSRCATSLSYCCVPVSPAFQFLGAPDSPRKLGDFSFRFRLQPFL